VATRNFVLLVEARGATDEKSAARLGITVSRRVGNAVARNRAKRLIREAFRATRRLWAPDIDVVVIARGPLGPIGLADVIAEWEKAQKHLERQIEQARRDRDAQQDRLAETR
jgi:ribonuclease P protein component